MRIVLPTLLGIEALVASEIEALGYSRDRLQLRDGQVYLSVEHTREALSEAIARLNVNIGCGERVELEILEAKVEDFETLYEVVRAFPWNGLVPRGSQVHVAGGYSRQSQIYGIPSCQRIIKKAILDSLRASWGLAENAEVPEDRSRGYLKLQFSFMRDQFSLRVDTTGDGLHKRGYRTQANLAPLKETLAASLLGLIHFEPFGDTAIWDPFCGSGTLLIEAARKAAGLAPGAKRHFQGESLAFLDPAAFDRAREEALAKADLTPPDEPFFFGTDVDPEAIAVARLNAERAGVAGWIDFSVADIHSLTLPGMLAKTKLQQLIVLTNPPYGERLLSEEEARALLSELGRICLGERGLLPDVKLFVITADPQLEGQLGFEADKRRKLYNGMIPCQFFQYFRKEAQEPKKLLPVRPREVVQPTLVARREKGSWPVRKPGVNERGEGEGRPPRKFDGERRPYRGDRGEDRPPRKFDGERRTYRGDRDEGHPPRKFDGERRPYRDDRSEGRPPRKFDGERRPYRGDRGEGRPPRKFDGERRPYPGKNRKPGEE